MRTPKTDAQLLAECAALDLCYANAVDVEPAPLQADWINTLDREDDPENESDLLRKAALNMGQP
jgi:hypothetical protein